MIGVCSAFIEQEMETFDKRKAMRKNEALIQKYNQPVPRYTSYPTVPMWDNNLETLSWEVLVQKAFQCYGKDEGIALYIHLPFCESLCTYCGCTKYITKNHSLESPYIQAILLEWKKYLSLFDSKPLITGIHLGGGTPTFFSPSSLDYLLSTILSDCIVTESKEFSFEGHPNNTTKAHLNLLYDLGFDRVSFGIQDFDLTVQKAIHRIQPLEKVKSVTQDARNIGYKSINFDLIYGLPHQTKKTLIDTFQKVAELAPERIAFYSYAHLPNTFKAQKSFEAYLPKQHEKRELYELGKQLLLEAGYEEIGMDHFALPEDPLCIAKRNGKLHRNFMGYTTFPGKIMIGLGASSISDIHLGYAQNEKNHQAYSQQLSAGDWAILKGHISSKEDLLISDLILELICNLRAEVPSEVWDRLPEVSLLKLREMEREGIVTVKGQEILISDLGKAFIRNVCSLLDLRMIAKKSSQVEFSKSI